MKLEHGHELAQMDLARTELSARAQFQAKPN